MLLRSHPTGRGGNGDETGWRHQKQRAWLWPAVLWRKCSFGSDSEAGSRFAERLLTMAASCRWQGRPRLGFLAAASEAAVYGTAAPSLLPASQGDRALAMRLGQTGRGRDVDAKTI